MRRILSPYEINHLRKFGIDPETIARYGNMPVEYVAGYVEVFGRDFAVDSRVLIPRVEAEILIKLAVKCSMSLPSSLTLADIGTGSGVLGITIYLELLKQKKTPTVYLSDISAGALKITAKNILLLANGHQKNLIIFNSNLLSSYPSNVKFDLIVANLPYIPSGRISKLSSSVRDFEPLLALDGGPDGLTYIRKLVKQAIYFLKSTGRLIMEIDETHQLKDLTLPKEFSAEMRQDQFGKNRFIVLSKK